MNKRQRKKAEHNSRLARRFTKGMNRYDDYLICRRITNEEFIASWIRDKQTPEDGV
jgi:hypothetical protein